MLPIITTTSERGSNNNFLRIRIGLAHPNPLGVLLQERREFARYWMFHHLWAFLAIMFAFYGLTVENESYFLIGLVIAVVAEAYSFVPVVKRWHGIKGQATEVVSNVRFDKVDLNTTLDQNAEQLHTGSYRDIYGLKNKTRAQVRAMLEAELPGAERWINDHPRFLAKAKQLVGWRAPLEPSTLSQEGTSAAPPLA